MHKTQQTQPVSMHTSPCSLLISTSQHKMYTQVCVLEAQDDEQIVTEKARAKAQCLSTVLKRRGELSVCHTWGKMSACAMQHSTRQLLKLRD